MYNYNLSYLGAKKPSFRITQSTYYWGINGIFRLFEYTVKKEGGFYGKRLLSFYKCTSYVSIYRF